MFLAAAESTDMSTFLTTIGSFFTQVVTWMGELMTYVIASPALTILVLAMPIIGFVVGYLNRLIRL